MSSSPIQHFYSHGKLLITGEYLVLDGAKALAVPTAKGQSLQVEMGTGMAGTLHWISRTADGQIWFERNFELPSGRYLGPKEDTTALRLEQLFQAALDQRPDLRQAWGNASFLVQTKLEFPRNWGLGSSSTLVANLAQWLELDAYRLLADTFGGSGYDLACAVADSPIFYWLKEGAPQVEPAPFYPPFSDQLYFLFLEKKQDSREGIALYRQHWHWDLGLIPRVSELSGQATGLSDLRSFQELMALHENIVSGLIKQRPIKQALFPDFPGAVKSLGAWGGDFALVASDRPFEELQAYFYKRGYPLLIPYGEMVLGAQ